MVKKSELSFYCVVCLLIIFIANSGCKKKEPIQYTIPIDLKQLALFQKGSYWIYQNESTQKQDCTFISADPEYYRYGGTNGEPISEYIILRFTSSFLAANTIDHLGYNIVSKYISGIAYYVNGKIGLKYISEGSIYEYVNHFDSVTINNIVYHDVIKTKFSTPSNGSKDSIKATYLLTKNIGLIQMMYTALNRDSTWTLVKCHTIQ